MTIQSSCFWSLLSLDKLEFIHIPLSIGKIKIATENNHTTIQSVLLHRSLFEFMHPNEITLAKNDLSSFLKLKTLAGSVTRCRLLSLRSMAWHVMSNNSSISSTYQDWKVIDLVIYTATEDTVLAFFHNTDFGSCNFNDTPITPYPTCTVKSDKTYFDYEDALHLTQALKLIQKSPASQIIDDAQLVSPIRVFQIVDSISLKPLFVWPQLYSFVDMVQSMTKKITLKEFKNPSAGESSPGTIDDVYCTRHFYANSKIELFNSKKAYNFQRILIPYGNILFESFQVTPMSTAITAAATTITAAANTTTGAATTDAANISISILGIQQHGTYSNHLLFYDFSFGVKKSTQNCNEKEEVDRKLPLPLQHRRVMNDFAIEERGGWPQKRPSSQANEQATPNSTSSPPNAEISVLSPSSHLRKFRIQQHPRKELAIKQQSFPSTPIEKKKRNTFHGLATTSSSTSPEGGTKVCTRCHTSNSPEWRRGPDGHKTLCNACGLRYSRFRSKQWRTGSANTFTTSSSSSPTNSSFSTSK